VRGIENVDVTFGRLKNAEKWNRILKSPLKTLSSPFFSEFQTKQATFPLWGVR
jgi:hypothetical protein